MLKLINLYVLNKIFTEVAEIKLGATARAFYVNCLTEHFKDKKPTTKNAFAFSILNSDIPNIEKYSKILKDLQKADLIKIDVGNICFYNVWGKYIDKTLLDKETEEDKKWSPKPASSFMDEILNNQTFYELSMMKYKLGKTQLTRLIEVFVKEQDSLKKKYSNFEDCMKHCNYWINVNSDKVPKETAKSTSKILGKD